MSAQNQPMKVAVSVSEMARMVGLSRARFYQLMTEGCFPRPTYDTETGRPYYSEEQQIVCLDVRRRNCGIDNKPVLFYARQVAARSSVSVPRRPIKAKPQPEAHDHHVELLDAVKALGLTTATAAQVKAAVSGLYPQGVAGIDMGEIVRKVFLYLKRQDSTDNVRR